MGLGAGFAPLQAPQRPVGGLADVGRFLLVGEDALEGLAGVLASQPTQAVRSQPASRYRTPAVASSTTKSTIGDESQVMVGVPMIGVCESRSFG